MFFQGFKLYSQMTPEEKEEVKRRRQEEEMERERQQQERIQKMEEAARQRQLIRQRLYENDALFLKTEGLYVYDPQGSISSRELYDIYQNWCIREELPIKPPREFWLHIKEAAPRYRLTYSGNILDRNGKRCRGFRGIRALNDSTDNTDNTDILQ